MLFNLPSEGNASVVFYVKSKTAGFFPTLYASQQNYQDITGKKDNPLTFPPDELLDYYVLSEDWDKDLYVMKASLHFTNLRPDSFIALNLKYHSDLKQSANTTAAEAVITVSHTKVTKLQAGADYFGEMPAGGLYRYHLFKITSPSTQNVTMITYSMCVGLTMVSVVSDPENLNDRKQV